MAIDDNTVYGLTGAQVKELPEKINEVRGMAKVLTTADYNYPADNPTGVALWLLDYGMYVKNDNNVVTYYMVNSSNVPQSANIPAIVYPPMLSKDRAVRIKLLHGYSDSNGNPNSYTSDIDYLVWKNTGKSADGYVSDEPGSYSTLNNTAIVDSLNYRSTVYSVLSANQGYAIKESLLSLMIDDEQFNTLWEEA